MINKDEKRILAAVEQQRADQIRRQAAAKLIQASWRQYHFNKNVLVEADNYDYRASKITNFFSKKKTLPGRRSGFHICLPDFFKIKNRECIG